jgi:ribosomal protein S18 acetylase RimI-like enzyme
MHRNGEGPKKVTKPNRELKVRRARIGDVDEIADLLAEAFSDYPWTRWTVDEDDHRARIRSLQRVAMTELALPYGQVWVTLDALGDIASAAVWMDPGPPVPSEVLRRVARQSAILEAARHPLSAAAELALAPLRPRSAHYYLGAVGTRTDCRRSGHGRSVLRPVLELADLTDHDTYLETSTESNLRFYTSLGFRVTGAGAIPGGGPHVWAMLRSSPRPGLSLDPSSHQATARR